MILKRKTTYLQKCDYCGRAGHYMYHTTIGEHQYKLCSNDHVQKANENYLKNKNSLGVISG